MSRRKNGWHPPATVTGIVYLLHLDPPLKHARHYTGFHAGTLDTLQARLDTHAAGRGAKMLARQVRAGGTWRLAHAEEGTTLTEHRRKYRGASGRCPICRAAEDALSVPEACQI